MTARLIVSIALTAISSVMLTAGIYLVVTASGWAQGIGWQLATGAVVSLMPLVHSTLSRRAARPRA